MIFRFFPTVIIDKALLPIMIQFPFSIATNVYPDVALPSVDVQQLRAINCNSSNTTMEPPFSSVCIGLGINMNKRETLETSFNSVHCDSTNAGVEPASYRAPVSSSCVQSSYGISLGFYASKFCNASGPIRIAINSAPPEFPLFASTN